MHKCIRMLLVGNGTLGFACGGVFCGYLLVIGERYLRRKWRTGCKNERFTRDGSIGRNPGGFNDEQFLRREQFGQFVLYRVLGGEALYGTLAVHFDDALNGGLARAKT